MELSEETAEEIARLLRYERVINSDLESRRHKVLNESPFDKGRKFAGELFGMFVGKTYIVDARKR